MSTESYRDPASSRPQTPSNPRPPDRKARLMQALAFLMVALRSFFIYVFFLGAALWEALRMLGMDRTIWWCLWFSVLLTVIVFIIRVLTAPDARVRRAHHDR